MLDELKELWRFRELLLSMVQRELRIRYKNSVIGVLWSFLTPLATTAVMWFVFSRLLGITVDNYAAYVLVAQLPYTFFQMATLDSAQSVLVSLPVVKKVYFPREILPLASIISNFIHLGLGFVVFYIFLIGVYVVHPGHFPIPLTTIYLPVLLLVSLMLSIGTGLFVSALNTFYEDVKYMVSVGMYLLFFLCPTIYFIEQVQNSSFVKENPWVFKLYNANPLASLITNYRRLLLEPLSNVPMFAGQGVAKASALPPTWWKWLLYDGFVAFAIMVFGYWYFNRVKWRFVERP